MELHGTERADVLTGGADGDILYGFGGNDTLKGGAGDDVLAGNDGADVLQGGDGDDYLLGGAGNDTIDGGAGNDWAAYEDATAGVKVDLSLTGAQNTVGGGTDKLTSIENVYGSDFNDILTGNAEANMMVGGKGADVVNGGKGDDTLWGSAGNDTLDGGDGDDYLVGGAGDDVIKGGAGWDWSSYEDATAGVVVDLTKTGAQDTLGGGKDTLTGIEHLYGTQFDDILTGDANDNYLWADAGDDKLYGGAGDDHLSGGAGADLLDGGEGHDTVDYSFSQKGVYIDLQVVAQSGVQGWAESGDQLISIESLMGSEYNDVFFGNAAENYLYGAGGDDLLVAVGGYDTLEGGEGDDRLVTSTNASGDLLLGGAGDDRLTSLEAKATLDGGAGADLIEVTNYLDDLVVDGGEGVDTIDFGNGYDNAIGDGAHVDLRVLDRQKTGNLAYVQLRNVENVVGTLWNDKFVGDAKDNVLTGVEGDDVLDGGEGSDTASYMDGYADGVTIDLGKQLQAANGAHGIDTLISIENVIGSTGADNITGNAAANRLEGGAGADWLYGVGGNDVLDGGAGDDVLVATREGASSDRLFGGAGNDRLVTNKSAATLDGGDGDDVFDVPHVASMAGVIAIDGGAGVDTLDMSGAYGAPTGLKIDLSIKGKQDVGQGQFLDIKGVENVYGGDANDVLKGDGANNLLRGAGGDDLIDGGAGVDIVDYSDNFPTSVSIDLRNSVQTNLGGRGTDTLISIEGVKGTAYNDTLIGNDQDNILIGGMGDDVIDGGAGIDTVSYLNDGGQLGVWVNLQATIQDIDKGAHGKDSLTSIENVQGSNFDDTIWGTTGVNVLRGEGGNDALIGRGGADILDGGDGDDSLDTYFNNGANSDGAKMYGGAGDDNFDAGAGDILMDGGVGDDEFKLHDLVGSKVLHGGDGMDAIYFQTTVSGMTLDLSKTTKQEIAPGAFLTVDSIERVGGSDFADRLTGHDGGVYLDGWGGDDVLVGGAGADTLLGGAGADTIIGGKGRDVMRGDAGVDVFKFATGDSVATDALGSGVDRIVYFEANDKLAFDENFLGDVSFTASSATSYADALAKAMVHLSSTGTAARFSAYQVGADVYVFAGHTDASGGHLDNVIQLAGVSVNLIDMATFIAA